MFKSLVALTILGFAVAAPTEKRDGYLNQVVNGQVATAWCGAAGSSTFEVSRLKTDVPFFCEAANKGGNFNPHIDIGDGYWIQVTNLQDGDYAPCQDAFNWIISNFAEDGRVGQYQTNANNYKFDKN